MHKSETVGGNIEGIKACCMYILNNFFFCVEKINAAPIGEWSHEVIENDNCFCIEYSSKALKNNVDSNIVLKI